MADETAQGIASAGALKDAERKAMAYNALASTYGPAANDPEAWGKTVQAAGEEAQLPYKGPQAAANLAQTGAQTNYLGAETRHTTAQAQGEEAKLPYVGPQAQASLEETQARTGLTGAQAEEAGATTAKTAEETKYVGPEAKARIAQQQASAGALGAQAESTRVGTAGVIGERDRAAAYGMLSSLSDTADNGGDVGAAFDQMAPQIARMEGVDQNHIQPLRDMFVQDPKGTIEKLSAAIAGSSAASMKPDANGVTPVQKRAQMVEAISTTRSRTSAVPDTIDQALALIPKMSGSAIIRWAAMHGSPGGAEGQFSALLDNLKDNMALTDVQNLKASGATLGRYTNTEFLAMSRALANLDIRQPPQTLMQNLQRIKQTYGGINENLNADIKRLSVGVPGLPPGVKNPSAKAQTFQEGKTYTDAKGNKATYKGGKWVEAP